jgi:hypothetical protein
MIKEVVHYKGDYFDIKPDGTPRKLTNVSKSIWVETHC